MGAQAGGAHVPTGGGQSVLGTSVERTAKLGLLLRAPHQRRSSGSCEMLSCARTRWPARDRASGCFLTSPLLGIHSSIYAGRSWGMRHRLPHARGTRRGMLILMLPLRTFGNGGAGELIDGGIL